MTSETTTLTIGSFTVTPRLSLSGSQSIVLSDKDGNCYYENGGSKVNANSKNDISTTYKQYDVTFTIAYSGELTQASEILTAWNAAAGDNFVVTFADTTGYTSSTPSAAIVGVAGTDGKKDGADYGLKVVKAGAPSRTANGWKNAGSEGTKVNTLASDTFSLDNPGTFSTPARVGETTTYTSSVTTSAVSATFYVGIVGIDGVAQTAGDSYACTFSVSGGGI